MVCCLSLKANFGNILIPKPNIKFELTVFFDVLVMLCTKHTDGYKHGVKSV